MVNSPNRNLIAVNVAAAVLPVLGYMADPTRSDPNEIVTDVISHSIVALSLVNDHSLNEVAFFINNYRLVNPVLWGTTFPTPVAMMDACIHIANLVTILNRLNNPPTRVEKMN